MSFCYDLKKFPPSKIRNFSVIAHIDHGKSTLCDRLLEITGTLSNRVRHEQFLDKLQVEKERGITVKAQSATMVWKYKGEEYLLNLIDTPGHVDFSYEVSRSLYACQGALLLVDATQGVQAQTMANFYLAFSQDLTILPCINKIDIASADPDRVKKEIETLFDFKPDDCLLISGKSGIGIENLLNRIIEKIPTPQSNVDAPFKALLFDSWYDEYKGVISLIAVRDGTVKKGDKISLHQTGMDYEVLEIGLMYPEQVPTDVLYAGQVGYIIAGMKTVKEACIGDTVHIRKQEVTPFPGFKPPRPMVFAGIFPVANDDYEILRDAIEKLTLNDASVKVEKTHSTALGIGFRCGFLGLLHMEVFQQRLEQEYNVSVIATAPNVLYKVKLKNGEEIDIESPAEFPDPSAIESVFEPIIKATILLPKQYIGPVMELCQKKRGQQLEFTYLSEDRVVLVYRLPLNEVAIDFYDNLKSITSGYASLDYEEMGYSEDNLVKMDILLNGKAVDALSVIVHEERAYYMGKDMVERLREVIERQMFEVVIQAAIGSKILSRSNISAFRKDVTAHCYGGDITRKMKLREKQKEGKKKMKMVGNVEVPQEAFLVVLNKKDQNKNK
jgi:elongation factor 4